MSEKVSVDATLKRIAEQPGVHGIIVINGEGAILRSNLDNATTEIMAMQCRNLAEIATGAVRDLDPRDGMTILRVRSKKNELIIAPYQECMLIVVQNNLE